MEHPSWHGMKLREDAADLSLAVVARDDDQNSIFHRFAVSEAQEVWQGFRDMLVSTFPGTLERFVRERMIFGGIFVVRQCRRCRHEQQITVFDGVAAPLIALRPQRRHDASIHRSGGSSMAKDKTKRYNTTVDLAKALNVVAFGNEGNVTFAKSKHLVNK